MLAYHFSSNSASSLAGLIQRASRSRRIATILAACAALHAEVGFGAVPLAQDYKVVWHNPDRESYVEGCGLVRMDDGALVAAVPVVPRSQWRTRRVEHSRIHVVRSDDRGATWKRVSELPYYTAIPWTHAGKLYLFVNRGGTTYRNDDLELLRSDDGGRTWTKPVTLFKGHFWNAHGGIVVHKNTLYAATDNLALGSSYDLAVGMGNNVARGSCVVAGDLSKDPMDPAAWRISNTVPLVEIPRAIVNPKFADGASYSHYLEPNVIEVQGKLRVLATVKPHRQSTANLGIVLDLNDEGGKLDLKFSQYFPMPGGQLKYCVIWDEKGKMFWATSNLVVDSQATFDWWKKGAARGNFTGSGGNDRRFLMLHYSLDGLNWFPAGCVAQAPKISQSFMYARPVIDGDDLAIISRSSVDAPNQHDADYATFHRVRNFRQLALNLVPQPE